MFQCTEDKKLRAITVKLNAFQKHATELNKLRKIQNGLKSTNLKSQ